MKFGIFEHMDECGLPLVQQFEDRLQLAEAYDRYGFYAYHLAEHHGTPLGLAPSPNIFLAALAQRTKRLRFGPLTYSLPLYHPIRLIEEICMLDQMSNGRLEFGVGRGVSPYEVGFYGVNPKDGARQFPEALSVIKKGLTSDELSFDGEFYQFKNVPMVLKPVQRPWPPIWYGVLSPDAAYWAALESAHVVTLVPPTPARAIFERYRQEWKNFGRPDDTLPLMGISRHIVLADTESEALSIAERAYRVWQSHMELLWVKHGSKLPLGLPPDIGPMLSSGAAFAGTPSGLKDYIDEQMAQTTANYLVCDVAFGDLTFEESMRTVRMLGEEVMPEYLANASSEERRANLRA